MLSHGYPALSLFLAGIIATMFAVVGLACRIILVRKSESKEKHILDKLPSDLSTWRLPPGFSEEANEQLWQDMDPVLQEKGFTQWPHLFLSNQATPGLTSPLQNGYLYSIPTRSISEDGPGTAIRLRRFEYRNTLSRAARTREGNEVIIRVIAINDEGRDHLSILRKVATGTHSLLSNNHVLPMLREFQFKHITFGVFPKVGGVMWHAYRWWAENSVGDVLDMVMQALEGLTFIHGLNIAHRDAFSDNFLVQWHPESMRTRSISASRPRVYLIDFEVAVAFEPDCPPANRVSIGIPNGGSMTEAEKYSRPLAPEMTSGKPYDPFKLDVWQLGTSLANFKSTIAPIDEILTDMASPDPASRMDTSQALARLGSVVHDMPPKALLIHPEVIPEEY